MSGSPIWIEPGDDEFAAWIENELLNSLCSSMPQSYNARLALVARSDGDEIAGGLSATTSYGWLLIKALWVDERFRRMGVGRSLMATAEAKARTLACHGAWLDTSNPDALSFYLSLGYAPFAELNNQDVGDPAGHRRWFLKKSLSTASENP